MKSKAAYSGHPIHPMLIPFPIAFFTGTFLLDLLLIIFHTFIFGQVAIYMQTGGIIFSLLAAIPGLIDYFYAVPPKSSAKKRAATHGLLNMFMFLIFIAALLMKLYTGFPIYTIVALEGVGVVLLTIAGSMGGTLVFRNQIGVDHRYAGAGKWKEEYLNVSSDVVELKNPELEINQMKLLHVNGNRIVLGRTESKFVAFDDHCPHKGGSLADGALVCETVQCPWHGSQFNVNTGKVNAGPAKENIKTYEVFTENGKVILKLK